MGNNFSSEHSDTIGFRNTNIEKYSSTLPYNHQIELDVNKVIENLPSNSFDAELATLTQQASQTQQGGGNLSEESLGLNDIFKKLEKQPVVQENDISDTSPFISSDMYNFLMKGGAKKSKKGKKNSKKSKKSKKASKKGKKSKGGDVIVEEMVKQHEHEHDLEATSATDDSSEEKTKKEKDDDSDEDSDSDFEYDSSPGDTAVPSKKEVETIKGRSFKQISSVNTSDIRLITE
jgi:hypothetical protein